MSTKDKLLERFKSLPKDFTFEEFIHVFEYLGFEQNNKGTTSGSRVRLEKGETYYNFHKPHPGNNMKRAVMKDAFEYLKMLNLL